MIKKFESFIKKEDAEEVSDYFLDWIDEKKWNIKLIKVPTKYRQGYGPWSKGYGSYIIAKKGYYSIRFEVKNDIESISIFTEELNTRVKRWNLNSEIECSTKGKKILFNLKLT